MCADNTNHEEFMTVFRMASALRWSHHNHLCRRLEILTPDPDCLRCRNNMVWDNYINSFTANIG